MVRVGCARYSVVGLLVCLKLCGSGILTIASGRGFQSGTLYRNCGRFGHFLIL